MVCLEFECPAWLPSLFFVVGFQCFDRSYETKMQFLNEKHILQQQPIHPVTALLIFRNVSAQTYMKSPREKSPL